MGVCEIRRIPCACVACTSMLDKPWISGIPSEKWERYQQVFKCTYWPVLGAFNNWNIIELSLKSTSAETFDEIHQVVLDGISDNMASLVDVSVVFMAPYLPDSTNDAMLSLIPSRTT